MQTVEHELALKCQSFERLLTCKLLDLTAKLNRATRDFHTIKMENQLKCESSARLVQSMQNLRLETEKNYQTIEDLKQENENLRRLRENAEQFSYELKLEISKKESEIDLLQKQMVNKYTICAILTYYYYFYYYSMNFIKTCNRQRV